MTIVKEGKAVLEPFARIVKRGRLPFWKNFRIRAMAIIIGLLLTAIITSASSTTGKGFFDVFGSMFMGAFGTSRRFWILVQDFALLLGVSVALLPVFKMKFWNLGGNGQILIGGLATTICMYYWGGKMPDPLLWVIMFVLSILAAGAWCVIPAFFKVFFKTNESLFTLMFNYIAIVLVDFFIAFWYPMGSGSMSPLEYGALPTLGEGKMGSALMCLLVVAVMSIGVIVYLVFSKKGYEISVIGESERTARYIGINVKVRMLFTAFLSGAICGLIGFLLTGLVNHTISSSMNANMGFTGIMVTWLAKFDPVMIAPTSFFITFINRGISQVRTDFDFASEALSSVIIGMIYFLIIASEFFTKYKIHLRPDIQAKIDIVGVPVKNFFAKVGEVIKKPFSKLTKKKEAE